MMHNPPITADDIDRVLKGLGSLAQNRPFSPADVTRYVGVDGNAVVAILVRSGLVKKTGRAEYSLTPSGRSAVEVALGGEGAPPVPVSQRNFVRPTVSEVARQLKNLAKAGASIDPIEGLDVRLQVTPKGGWKLWYGDPSKDLERGRRVPRHEGFWGFGVIHRTSTSAELDRLAQQLVDETEGEWSGTPARSPGRIRSANLCGKCGESIDPSSGYCKACGGITKVAVTRNPHPNKDAGMIESIGDLNPIEYGGGYIFSAHGGRERWIEWYEGLEADGLEEDDKLPVQIYRVDLPRNSREFLKRYDWVDWKKLAEGGFRGWGYSEYDLSPDYRMVIAIQDIAAYYGWNELDQYPLTLTLGELKDRWEEGQ